MNEFPDTIDLGEVASALRNGWRHIAAGVAVPLAVMHQQSENKLREAREALAKKDAEAVRLAAENARLASEAVKGSVPAIGQFVIDRPGGLAMLPVLDIGISLSSLC